MIIIADIILVDGIGAENGCQIENIHPQAADIAKMLDDATQGTLQVSFAVNGRLIPDFLRHLLIRGKAGRENLVNHLVFRPGRQPEPLFFPKVLGAVEHPVYGGYALVIKTVIAVIHGLSRVIRYLEKIPQADHVYFHFRLVIVYIIVGTGDFHGPCLPCIHIADGQVFILCVERYFCRIPLLHFQPDQEMPLCHGITISFIRKMSDCRVFHILFPPLPEPSPFLALLSAELLRSTQGK